MNSTNFLMKYEKNIAKKALFYGGLQKKSKKVEKNAKKHLLFFSE